MKYNTTDFTYQDFNHDTENKATPAGLTALTLMSLLNGEIIKSKVRSLPVSFKQPLFSSYDMIVSISRNQFTQCFATYAVTPPCSGRQPTMFRASFPHVIPRGRMPDFRSV